MKKFVAFVMILSLGLLTIGCTPPNPAKDKDKDKPATVNKDKAAGAATTPQKTPERTEK